MTKTPEEILQAMRICRDSECMGDQEGCPYAGHDPEHHCCVDEAHDDAIELIKKLWITNRALREELWANGVEVPEADQAAKVDQEAKADAGKPRLTLVPPEVLWAIAAVREYGCRKYGDPDNWKKVSPQRYRDAAFRHFMAYLDAYRGKDPESGLPHLWHCATNIAFLCAMEGMG